MRIIVIGLGNQGLKRKSILGKFCLGTVDPLSVQAEFSKIQDVPLEIYDAAFVCTPDAYKSEIIQYLINNGKDVLCEKPLLLSSIEDYVRIESLANQNKVKLYTAYNHRFEPSITKVKKILDEGELGKIYLLKIFYGNGTAKLVKQSDWRDSGSGVIADLGSHCIDLVRYLFPKINFTLTLASVDRFENKAPDHALLISQEDNPRISIEISLCSWKNNFQLDIIGENGDLSIYGLNKWGDSRLVKRIRVFPSGTPIEYVENYQCGDKTWNLEHEHFFSCVANNISVDLRTDKCVFEVLSKNLRLRNFV